MSLREPRIIVENDDRIFLHTEYVEFYTITISVLFFIRLGVFNTIYERSVVCIKGRTLNQNDITRNSCILLMLV